MPSKKSGGKRAGEKKRAQQAAARGRSGSYAKKWAARYTAIGDAPTDTSKAYGWLARVLLTAIEEAAHDPGMAPEARREQLGRLIAQATKVIDPARMSERLDELERALAEADGRH